MKLDNLYNGISKFSISSIINGFIFESKPSLVFLAGKYYLVYPLGIKDGVILQNYLCENIFNNVYVRYFKDQKSYSQKNMFYDFDFLSSLFTILSELYNLDEEKSLYDILQSSSFKQVKYFIYTIKNQNFTWFDINKYSEHSYSDVVNSIEKISKIFNEYKTKQAEQGKNKQLVDINAIEYNAVSSTDIKYDYTMQFFKDYVIGNDNFYTILLSSFTNKFVGVLMETPYVIESGDPKYWCKILNTSCTQSCNKFSRLCVSKYIKNYSYFPFKALYVFPQLLSLTKSVNKEYEFDVMIRSLIYSIQSSFGEKTNLKYLYNFNHNDAIVPMLEKNKMTLIKNLFDGFGFDSIENKLRESLGLTERTENSFDNLHETVMKISKFIETNVDIFLSNDETRHTIFKKFVDVDLNNLLHEYDYPDLSIFCFDDFSNHIIGITESILYIDNMLMKFPNDMKNMDTVVNNMLKYIKTSKTKMKKLTGSQAYVDPRETLLTSDTMLFKRIAVDDGLYQFYRENNRTRLVNNILFWKWTIAYSFFAEMVLKLPEDHVIQKMDFNDI